MKWLARHYGPICAAILAAELLFSPAIYFGVLNFLGPSTQYYEPSIEGADLGRDGKYYATVGDKIFVRYIVIRNKINGSCRLNIWRYAENIGGPEDGKRHLLDYADLAFVGANELRRPRWPLDGLVLGGRGDMLPRGVDQQEFALYVVGRYRCNFWDAIIPRYLQGGPVPDRKSVV